MVLSHAVKNIKLLKILFMTSSLVNYCQHMPILWCSLTPCSQTTTIPKILYDIIINDVITNCIRTVSLRNSTMMKPTMNNDSSIVSKDSLLLPSKKYFFLTCDQCVLSLDVKAAISNSASFATGSKYK